MYNFVYGVSYLFFVGTVFGFIAWCIGLGIKLSGVCQ